MCLIFKVVFLKETGNVIKYFHNMGKSIIVPWCCQKRACYENRNLALNLGVTVEYLWLEMIENSAGVATTTQHKIKREKEIPSRFIHVFVPLVMFVWKMALHLSIKYYFDHYNYNLSILHFIWLIYTSAKNVNSGEKVDAQNYTGFWIQVR